MRTNFRGFLPNPQKYAHAKKLKFKSSVRIIPRLIVQYRLDVLERHIKDVNLPASLSVEHPSSSSPYLHSFLPSQRIAHSFVFLHW